MKVRSKYELTKRNLGTVSILLVEIACLGVLLLRASQKLMFERPRHADDGCSQIAHVSKTDVGHNWLVVSTPLKNISQLG